MILIIDEWIWHDLAGENGEENQKKASQFLLCILKICDKIALMEKSAFVKKFWKFKENIPREIVKILLYEFFHNSNKCEKIDYQIVSSNLNINQDDAYLYSLYQLLSYQEKIIVSTDKALIKELERNNIIVIHKDQFLKKYIQKCHEIS